MTEVRALALGSLFGLTGVVQLAAAQNHACARLTDGDVWCWGSSRTS
jgi:hypothetical protein